MNWYGKGSKNTATWKSISFRYSKACIDRHKYVVIYNKYRHIHIINKNWKDAHQIVSERE